MVALFDRVYTERKSRTQSDKKISSIHSLVSSIFSSLCYVSLLIIYIAYYFIIKKPKTKMKKSYLIILLFAFIGFSHTANAQYTKLLDFAGTINGSSPYSSLIYDGSFLYGTISDGGLNSFGTIFKIKTDGSGYVKIIDFNGTNGGTPTGSLIYDGSFLYGMTNAGGANNYGTIFKIKPDGTGYVKLLDFNGATNGNFPTGSLISDGSFLYGMTYFGGANGTGTVFKYGLTVPAQPSAITGNVSVCSGTVNTYSVAAVTGATSYTWSLPSGWVGISTTDSITVTAGTSGGNITVTANNSYGSSVAQTATVTVNALPPTPTITASGAILTSSAASGNQWYLNSVIIVGATAKSYTATKNGNYSVVVTNAQSCSASSAIYALSAVGIAGIENSNSFVIYPNPNKGDFTIEGTAANKELVITNVLGELIFKTKTNSGKTEISLSNMPAGIYFLQINTENGIISKKVFIQD
jgi:uncharacterized repeat protein (TIGR03803 family)